MCNKSKEHKHTLQASCQSTVWVNTSVLYAMHLSVISFGLF